MGARGRMNRMTVLPFSYVNEVDISVWLLAGTMSERSLPEIKYSATLGDGVSQRPITASVPAMLAVSDGFQPNASLHVTAQLHLKHGTR